MTKEERLCQIKEEEKLYKVLDKYFDAGWREWVKGIHQENDAANIQTLKKISEIRGSDFIKDLLAFMGKKNKRALLNITEQPKGVLLKDNRFKNIPEIMINKFTASAYREGEVYINIEPNKWVSFVF